MKLSVPSAEPILGVDPSFRYLGACIAEAPPGFYTKEYYSDEAKRMYQQQYAYSIEQFNLRWWDCLQVTAKTIAKITPEAIPPTVNTHFVALSNEWHQRYPGQQPRVAFEWSFVGIASQATQNHLTYVGGLYQKLWDWSGGNIVRLTPAQHQRFFYRYAGVRLYGYTWDAKKGRKRTFKQETQDLVNRLHEQYWQTAGAHPVSPTKNYRDGKRSNLQQYGAVADAISVAATGLARWEELKV